MLSDQKFSHLEGTMATKRDVSAGFKKALLERTAGTGTMEEMMVEQAAVIAATSFLTFAYRHSGIGAPCRDLEGIGGAERIFEYAEVATSGDRLALNAMIAILHARDRDVAHNLDALHVLCETCKIFLDKSTAKVQPSSARLKALRLEQIMTTLPAYCNAGCILWLRKRAHAQAAGKTVVRTTSPNWVVVVDLYAFQ